MSRLQEIANLRQGLIPERRDLVTQVTAVRENTVAKLPELIRMAKESLQGKLAKVYLAKNAAEAAAILRDLVQDEVEVCRAHSSVLAEIGFDKVMGERKVKVNLTSLEEVIQKELGVPGCGHPHFSLLDQPREALEDGLRRFTGERDGRTATELNRAANEKIRGRIIKSDYGVTGVDCVVAENGVLVLAEDQGNVRAVEQPALQARGYSWDRGSGSLRRRCSRGCPSCVRFRSWPHHANLCFLYCRSQPYRGHRVPHGLRHARTQGSARHPARQRPRGNTRARRRVPAEMHQLRILLPILRGLGGPPIVERCDLDSQGDGFGAGSGAADTGDTEDSNG